MSQLKCFSPTDSNTYVKEFFVKVSSEIDKNKDDGTLSDVFRPALDLIAAECRNFTIMHTEVNRYINLLMFFTQTEPLAQVSHYSEMFLNYVFKFISTKNKLVVKTISFTVQNKIDLENLFSNFISIWSALNKAWQIKFHLLV